MITTFKVISSGISFGLLYMFLVFMSPILLMFLNYSHINSKPTIFGFPLYIIKLNGHQFSSEATLLGVMLSILLGLLFYLIIQFGFSLLKKQYR